MGTLGDFGPALEDAQLNSDGSLKTNGKQRAKFRLVKRLAFKAKRDENGKLIIDPKTGIPAKEAYNEEVEFIRVETKGDTNIVDDVANDMHRSQFYREYKFFRDGRIPDGNPIEDFDWLQPSTIMELHYYGIHTIQQVAVMEDTVCERVKDQSGFEVRDIAAQWVRINSPQGQNANLVRAENRVRELERKLAAMEADKKTAQDNLPPPIEIPEKEPFDPSAAVQTAPKPRGRPRKVLV